MVQRVYSSKMYWGKNENKPEYLELGDIYLSVDTNEVTHYGEDGSPIENNSGDTELTIGGNGNFFINGEDTGISPSGGVVKENVYTLTSSNITPLGECLGEVTFENFNDSSNINEVTFDGSVISITNNINDLEIECYIKTFGSIKLSRPFYLFEDNISVSISDSEGIYGNYNLSSTKIKIKKNSNIEIKIAHSSSLGNHKLTLDSFIKIKEI